MKAAKMKTVKT